MSRIPCTECRKRKETEAELKELKSEHLKAERKLAHRSNKIAELKDLVKRLRASTSAHRKMERRLKERYADLLQDRDELRRALNSIKRNVTRAIEESHLG